jgi:hypothetical protein
MIIQNAEIIHDGSEVVETFLELNHYWFETPTNSYYGTWDECRQYLNQRMTTGEYPDDHNKHYLIMLDRKFDEFLYIEQEGLEKAFDL